MSLTLLACDLGAMDVTLLPVTLERWMSPCCLWPWRGGRHLVHSRRIELLVFLRTVISKFSSNKKKEDGAKSKKLQTRWILRRQSHKIGLEFHGCFWHGCTKCYSRDTVNHANVAKRCPSFTNWRWRFVVEQTTINYFDKKALYHKYGKYPPGHPEIITENFQDL